MREGYFTHEKLARLFVMGMYAAGTLLTLLLVVEALRWGFLASFGRWRMIGLLFSFASAGLLISRLIAGRYGNRLAARLLPRRLPRAVSARRVMSDFGLVSIRDLCAFIQLYRLNAYSARKAMEGDFSHNLDCLLEPLFLHNMYLPMTRAWLVRSGRLVFDADALERMFEREKARLDALPSFINSFKQEEGPAAGENTAPLTARLEQAQTAVEADIVEDIAQGLEHEFHHTEEKNVNNTAPAPSTQDKG
ncbi:MAG TPA: hypothetical protein H9768_11080 [Candidatus Mailhella merdavium]|nr:hypothetical protein [Candidatus Mailhella merdavium]